MPSVGAIYYDGRTSRPHRVSLTLDPGVLIVRGDGVDRREPLATAVLDDQLGDAARVIRFADGAICEVRDTLGLRELLAAHGVHPSVVSQWEGHFGWIAAGVVVFLVFLGAGYWYGVPFAARVIAERIPPAATRELSSQTLAFLDSKLFEPSQLPADRRQAILAGFQALTFPSAEIARYDIQFRKSEAMGANAVALPSGPLVVTDALIALAQDDREILAVLAHEAGHVAHRHGLRAMLESSITGLVVAWFVGDVSTIASAAPSILIETSYSRDLEREADAFAAEVLRANGIPLEHFATMLQRLTDEDGDVRGAWRYLSSHPATAERLQYLHAR